VSDEHLLDVLDCRKLLDTVGRSMQAGAVVHFEGQPERSIFSWQARPYFARACPHSLDDRQIWPAAAEPAVALDPHGFLAPRPWTCDPRRLMIPTKNLGETRTPDGSRFSLHEHNGEYSLKLNGYQLMSSTRTASELLLADEACRFKKPNSAPKVLIGGLGLGFSLKRVLELVGAKAVVTVAELLPEVVTWNREFLGDLNGLLLDEKRVRIYTGDVFDCIVKAGEAHFNAILLDVDNGPTALVQPANYRLYDRAGLKTIYNSLKPGGRVSFWAASAEPQFPKQLRNAGFAVEEVSVKAYHRAKRDGHRIYNGERGR
jgi:SAM-dependent methyltransferase